MKDTAREILNLPVRSGETSVLHTLSDANGANLTAEQAMMLKQVQLAIQGSTDAATFLLSVASDESVETDDNTAIAEAAKKGDTLGMLTALRDKLSAIIDRSTSPREIAAITRQLMDVNDRIEKIEKAKERKEGENPLNVIRFNRAEKHAKRAAGA